MGRGSKFEVACDPAAPRDLGPLGLMEKSSSIPEASSRIGYPTELRYRYSFMDYIDILVSPCYRPFCDPVEISSVGLHFANADITRRCVTRCIQGCRSKGPKGLINTRIIHSGSKAQDRSRGFQTPWCSAPLYHGPVDLVPASSS